MWSNVLFEYKNEARYHVCLCFFVSYGTLFVYQATAEQIRLAQMIYDKNDADFEDKVKQVMYLCIRAHLDKFIFWMTSMSYWNYPTLGPSLHHSDLT